MSTYMHSDLSSGKQDRQTLTEGKLYMLKEKKRERRCGITVCYVLFAVLEWIRITE